MWSCKKCKLWAVLWNFQHFLSIYTHFFHTCRLCEWVFFSGLLSCLWSCPVCCPAEVHYILISKCWLTRKKLLTFLKSIQFKRPSVEIPRILCVTCVNGSQFCHCLLTAFITVGFFSTISYTREGLPVWEMLELCHGFVVQYSLCILTFFFLWCST